MLVCIRRNRNIANIICRNFSACPYYCFWQINHLIFSFQKINRISSKSEKNVNIIVCLNGEFEKISALVDSGCFLCDPLDGKPVIIVKTGLIGFTKGLVEFGASENEEIKRRVRIIPVKTLGEERILMGLRTDYIEIEGRKQRYDNIVIALDNEEGSFGGYAAIAPLSLIE